MAKKLLIICGPTATGKTSLAIRLAKKFDGEIISADSRQVYEGMDIGTGKDLPVVSNFQFPISNLKKQGLGCHVFDGIRVWLLDVVKPDQKFNVARYSQLAWKAIKEIWNRKKSRLKVEDPRREASGLPIIVGGTGFYIKAVIDGIGSLGIEPDWRLRKKLSNLEIEKLKEMLKDLDPERLKKMNESDRQNPRRLIRAIEIFLSNKKSSNIQHLTADVLIIGLMAPKKNLYQRIDKRVEERVKQGVEGEIRKILKKGYTWKNSVLGETIGYQEWQPFFEKKVTKKETIERWKFAEHAYARRQLTWFKKDKKVRWFDISRPGFEKKLEKLVRDWYTKSNAAKN